MQAYKVVLDTNIFISAFGIKGKLNKLLDYWKRNKFILFVSPQILDEYIGVISRPKFNIPTERIEDISNITCERSIVLYPAERIKIIQDDPSDNKFLECAIEANADLVVSNDQHLLELKTYRHISIISGGKFLKILAKHR